MGGGEHRAGSDPEMFFPLSKSMRGGIPYSETLLLSLASEKEWTDENTQIEILPLSLFTFTFPEKIAILLVKTYENGYYFINFCRRRQSFGADCRPVRCRKSRHNFFDGKQD
jgi:hypothetical protein